MPVYLPNTKRSKRCSRLRIDSGIVVTVFAMLSACCTTGCNDGISCFRQNRNFQFGNGFFRQQPFHLQCSILFQETQWPATGRWWEVQLWQLFCNGCNGSFNGFRIGNCVQRYKWLPEKSRAVPVIPAVLFRCEQQRQQQASAAVPRVEENLEQFHAVPLHLTD